MRKRSVTTFLKYVIDGASPLERWIAFKQKKEVPSREISRSADLLRSLVGLSAMRNTEEASKKQRVILVEALFEHPGCNYNSWLVAELLRGISKKTTKILAITRHKSSSATQVMHALGASEVIYWSGRVRFQDRLKALVDAIRVFKKVTWDPSRGWSVQVDGVEVGDLLHDDLLRKANLPTNQNKNLLLFGAIYFSLMRLRGYKAIINSYGISDIIVSHDVYLDFGLFHKAAPSEVTLWGWFGTQRFQIHQTNENRSTILKPKYQTEDLLGSILSTRDASWIREHYHSLMAARAQGKFVRNFDENNVNWGPLQDSQGKRKTEIPKIRIVVFAHIFVDAVNYAEWRLFPDYYIWLEETLIALAKNPKVSVLVRPHPSEKSYEVSVTVESLVDNIRAKYPDFDCKISSKSDPILSVLSSCDLVVTAAGTIAIEAPAYGVPTLVAASIRTEQAGAIIQPKSRAAYLELLQTIDSPPKLTADQITHAQAACWADLEYTEVPTQLNFDAEATSLADRKREWSKYVETLTAAFEQKKSNQLDDPLITCFLEAHHRDVGDLAPHLRRQIQLINGKKLA